MERKVSRGRVLDRDAVLWLILRHDSHGNDGLHSFGHYHSQLGLSSESQWISFSKLCREDYLPQNPVDFLHWILKPSFEIFDFQIPERCADFRFKSCRAHRLSQERECFACISLKPCG